MHDEEVFPATQVYHSAKMVCTALKNVQQTLPWPPHAKDIVEDNIDIPDIVYNLLAWILTDDNNDTEAISEQRATTDTATHQAILSLGQDLIHFVSKGRTKTPKHIALPMAVKNLTGSSEIINLLNCFGHGLSYTQVLSVDTALAEEYLEMQEGGISLPSNVQPNVFALWCWDNNDILEETLSGKGTTHCTNGIIIQRKALGCAPPPTLQPRRRSLIRHHLAPTPNQVIQAFDMNMVY